MPRPGEEGYDPFQDNQENDSAALKFYKQKYKEYTDAKKEKTDNDKYVIGALTDSYNTAKSPAMKAHIVATMKSYMGKLDPSRAELLRPYLRHSPISEEQERAREFAKFYPEPARPGAGHDENIKHTPDKSGKTLGSLEQVMGDSQTWAEDFFNHSDWEKKRDNVVFGKDITDRASFVRVPDGSFALRNKDGVVTRYSPEEISLKERAEFLGIPLAKLVANEGFLETGELKVNRNGKELTYKLYTDVVGNRGKKQELVGEGKSSFQTKGVNAATAKLIANTVIENTDKDPQAKKLLDTIKKQFAGDYPAGTAENILRGMDPSHDYRIVKTNELKPNFWERSWFSSPDSFFQIITIPGQPRPFKAADGKQYMAWVGEGGQVFDKNGVSTGMDELTYAQELLSRKPTQTTQTKAAHPTIKAVSALASKPPALTATSTVADLAKASQAEDASPTTVGPFSVDFSKKGNKPLWDFMQTVGIVELAKYTKDVAGFGYEELLQKPWNEIMKFVLMLYQEQGSARKSTDKTLSSMTERKSK